MFVMPSLGGGGAERVIATLLRHIDRERFRLSLAVVHAGAYFPKDIPADVQVFNFNRSRVRWAIADFLTLIRRERPDLVFSTLDYLSIVLGVTRPLWPASTRFVVRPAIMLTSNKSDPGAAGWMRLFGRRFYPRPDHLIFQSEALARDFHTFTGREAISCTVIHNPVDIEAIRQAASQTGELTSFQTGAFNLVSVGRLDWQKGYDTAIEALAKMSNKNVVLHILGQGAQLTSLKALTVQMGVQNRVLFHGFQANPYAFIKQADGFLLSSRYEGFPNVVLEALACGVRVAATPIQGIQPVLEGVRGCAIAERMDAEAVAEMLDDFVTSSATSLGQSNIDDFEASSIARRYEHAFEAVLSAGSGALSMKQDGGLTAEMRSGV